MAKVEIYTWQNCPYCRRAKEILDRYGVAYTEYKIDGDEEARTLMAERTEGAKRSVPQIFINGEHIGGSIDLQILDRQGQLQGLLAD